jgi:hypothetical protein
MRRAFLAIAIAAGLAIGTAIPTAAIGETQVTLSCDDGTSTTLLVNADMLTGLTQAVQAMIDFPAGLTCTLAKDPLLTIFGTIAWASPGQSPFIVGGGRWLVPCAALGGGGGGGGGAPVQQPPDTFWVNIAVNVHQADDGSFFGTLNETIPANQFCPTFGTVGESHFTSTPTCLVIVAASTTPPVQPPAFVTSQVTQTSGQRPFPAGVDSSGSVGTVNVGDDVHFGFQDNGNPGQQTDKDTLSGPPAVPSLDRNPDCSPGYPNPVFDLAHGNISTHP